MLQSCFGSRLGMMLAMLGTTNVGTVLFQMGLVFLALILANRWIAQRSLAGVTSDVD